MANIASYDATGLYLRSWADMLHYYEELWSWSMSELWQLHRYKTDEITRKKIFASVVKQDVCILEDIRGIAESVKNIWAVFSVQYQ